MNDLMSVVDWSRAQFALTAMYHWLFVPLTLGLSVIVAVMETIYYRTRSERWLAITKFWMRLFGINFAIGVATGIILEFEFGSNWSNYSWFVGDIFGAPLAIEGLLAFFMESTFVAVMFFGWKKVSPRFHLTATWLTAIGASISALWILIANAWMQYPVGMEFDPAQMRNVMDNFWEVALSPVAMHKFCHAVFSGWALAGVFVVGVSCWFIMKRRNVEMALRSIKVGGIVGMAGMLVTMWSGDGSALDVARVQPMKLAAMEGLYDGSVGQDLVGFGILNTDKRPGDDADPMHFEISIPRGLSLLANHDANSFVPGINDLINGIELTPEGDTVRTVSYAERIEIGRRAQAALRTYNDAKKAGDKVAMDAAAADVARDFRYFGYGYLDSAEQAVPPVALTFYAFRVMVMLGSFLLLVLVVMALASLLWTRVLENKWVLFAGMLSLPLVWICSQAGWIVAEVGRQPWTIQDLLPVCAGISDVPASSVQTTFWMFAVIFTLLLIAEVSIMVRFIVRSSRSDIEKSNN